MKRSADENAGPAPRKVAVERPFKIFLKGGHSNHRATFNDIHNFLLWLCGQKRHSNAPAAGSATAPAAPQLHPEKPDWVTVKNVQNVGNVLVVLIPYLDADVLRVYANSATSTGDESQLSQETMREFFGPIDETEARANFCSVLKPAARSKLSMRAPRVAAPPYCSIVQNFLSVATSSKSFRGVSLGNDTTNSQGNVCLSHYILTPEELYEREFPGFEEGTAMVVPEGYITLGDASLNSDIEQPRRSLLYGVDCEMVDTALGKELGHVCIVDSNCEVILDVLVKPSGPVLDYLTQYSGLTKDILDQATLSLSDLHGILKQRLPVGAILVGHSLEYDLRALRLVHKKCIDTSVLYPHNRKGLNLSLKLLAQLYLNKNMKRTCGHDPKEDAQAAMLLALKKIENGPAFAVPMTQLVPLAPCLRNLQRDTHAGIGVDQNKVSNNNYSHVGAFLKCRTADGTRTEEHGQGEDSGFLFLVDSFKYNLTSSLQDVTLRDGLSNDGAVIRACQDFLSCNPHGNGNGAGSSCKPRWGLCVLRAYQRLCSWALHAPTTPLYNFDYRPRKLLAAEAQLREKVEGKTHPFSACSSSSPVGNDLGCTSSDAALQTLKANDNHLEDPTISCCLRGASTPARNLHHLCGHYCSSRY